VPIPTFQKSSDVSGLVDLYIAKVSIIKPKYTAAGANLSKAQGLAGRHPGGFADAFE
jgi:hypothetical protein